MVKLAVLGSTGSIGTQTLDVAAKYPERWDITALAAYSNTDLLFRQIRQFHPRFAALVVEPRDMPEDIKNGCRWFFGKDALIDLIRACDADDVMVSVVGIAGLSAVMESLNHGRRVLLANKEPLVAGGELVIGTAKAKGLPILPVDSEHSAIFQCLQAAGGNEPLRLLLTASGGPFRSSTRSEIETATKEKALRHPNWKMGPKITIDSASMMNKALEVIEAHWLFDMPADRIDVLVHPQSIVHSMVEFEDGAVLAQLGTPDMRLPILYAMAWPERLKTGGARLDFAKLSGLSFEEPDFERFPALRLGYDALREGGTMPAILNGANEVAVDAFLHDRIRFGGIAALVEETMGAVAKEDHPDLTGIFEADRKARETAKALLACGRF